MKLAGIKILRRRRVNHVTISMTVYEIGDLLRILRGDRPVMPTNREEFIRIFSEAFDAMEEFTH